MNDLVISWLRTAVALVVGALVTWLGASAHIVLSGHSATAVTTAATAVVTFAYYSLVRLLEHYVPRAGVLLGYPAKPSYAPILADGAVMVTSLANDFKGPDPLAIDGADKNTPGASAPAPVAPPA